MARTNILISNGTGNLSDVGRFYQVEAWNLGKFGGNYALSNGIKYQLLTFANTGNAKGACLCFFITPTATMILPDRSVTVDLEESKGTATMTIASPCVVTRAGHGLSAGDAITFTTTGALPTGLAQNVTYYVLSTGLTADTFRFATNPGGTAANSSGSQSGVHTLWKMNVATSTLTASQILNAANRNTHATYAPFEFTVPYSVTTTANGYRLRISQASGSAVSWQIRTSDATNPFYFVWCDNSDTFADNDCVWFKDIVYIDRNATFKAQGLSTGETARSICGGILRSLTPTPENVSNLRWQFPAAASYTLTLDGFFVLGSHSSMLIGTHIKFTDAIAAGATSATLDTPWPYATGSYQIHFWKSLLDENDYDYKTVTLTNGSTAVSWTGGLVNACQNIAGVANSTANKAIITIKRTPTFGTVGYSGLCGQNADLSSTDTGIKKISLFFYGEVPAVEKTTLLYGTPSSATATLTIASPCVATRSTHNLSNNMVFRFTTTGALPTGLAINTNYYAEVIDANTFYILDAPNGNRINTSGTQSGSHTMRSVLITTDTTGWNVGDTCFVGKRATKNTDVNVRTISSISGTQIIQNSDLTYNAVAGATVIRVDGYGITMQQDSNAGNAQQYCLQMMSNLQLRGVLFKDSRVNGSNTTAGTALDDPENRSIHVINHCCHYISSGSSMAPLTYYLIAGEEGLFFGFNSSQNSGLYQNYLEGQIARADIGLSGYSYFVNNIHLNCPYSLGNANAIVKRLVHKNNRYENGSTYFIFANNLVNPVIKDNYLWGSSGTTGALLLGILVNADDNNNISGNYIDNCTHGVGVYTPTQSHAKLVGCSFGQSQANTNDVSFTQAGALADVTLVDCVGNLVVNETGLPDTVEGSLLRIVNFNTTTNDDRTYATYGKFQRCGDGLSDTTVRTSGTGKFSVRMQPTNGNSTLKFVQNVPTGNIQNKTMTVSVWVKIASANYHTGVHQNPFLKVVYDNGTVSTFASANSNTDWQQLYVTFTPTTTYGQITVSVEAATDALNSDAYVYVDDFNIAYPAGVQLDLGGMDLWANALPILPTIATVPSLAGVWDEATSAHTVAGSFGEKIKSAAVDGRIEMDNSSIKLKSILGEL